MDDGTPADGTSDDDGDANDAQGVAAWSRLMHVGAHDHDEKFPHRPELADVGLDTVHDVCVRAWKYSRTEIEPDWTVELTRSQWRETCALAGSTAESLMLASAAYIEAVWHQRAIAAGAEPEGMALAQRYLADAAVQDVVSIGHRLANFVARVARTSPDGEARFEAVEKLRPVGNSYVPFATDDTDAWLSLHGGTVSRLRNTLDPALHAGSVAALADLVASPEWVAVAELRGENFHRWRKEHEYVVGVDAQSGNAQDLFDDQGNHVGRSIYGHGRRAKIGDGLTARTTSVAGAGIRRVAQALDAILTNTVEVTLPTQHGVTVGIDEPTRITTRRRVESDTAR